MNSAYILLSILFLTGASQDRLGNPVALSHHANGGLALLDTGTKLQERVILFRTSATEITINSSFKLPYGGKFVDIVSMVLDQKEYVFVCSIANGSGLIQQFGVPEGKLIKTYFFGHLCGAITADSNSQILYAISPVSNEIYRLDLRTGNIKFVADLHLAGSLSALAIDISHQRMYVADESNGSLYLIDLTRKTAREITNRLKQPNSLAFDETSGVIYITSSSDRRVWLLRSGTTKPAVFSNEQELRTPTAITLDENHMVWLTDQDAHSLFGLSPQGKIVQRWPRHP